MTDRLLTPSKITAWLGCSYYLTLNARVESGELAVSPSLLGSLAEILVDKGNAHEAGCLEEYEALGKTIFQVPGRNRGEDFLDWVKRIGNPMDEGFDVIYQMPFVHAGIRGIADFLVRSESPEPGFSTYEPVDAKLTRSHAKPGHVLQLCFYAEAMEALLGAPPHKMHIWLGSGTTQALTVSEFAPYWRRLRRQLELLLSEEAADLETRPRPCESCEYCEFQGHCERQWRDEDSLAFVANSRESERVALEEAGVRTLVELSQRRDSVANLRDEKLARLNRQAALQVASRHRPNAAPAFEIIESSEDPVYGHGFELLPQPDEGDVFFDFEGDPFWSAEHDLMFLAGLYYRDGAGEWTFDGRWAHSLAEQQDMMTSLVEFFAERRRRYPGMHVYHYNHTERSTIERLTRDAEDENLFASLVESGLFVDLFTIAKNAVRVGTESYGLKHLEHLVDFVRTGSIEQGAGAVVEYEEWMRDGDQRWLDNIASYNEDDVKATLALRDWLIAQRPADLPWREAVLEREVYELDTDELVEGLHDFADDSPEHHGPPSRLSMALLAGDAPRFAAGQGPRGGVFDARLESIYGWVEHLDESFVAIQGPPGTGKTYSGSHIIHHLIGRGLRVGVLAMSHAAIDNLTRATVKVFAEKGNPQDVKALRWVDDAHETIEGVTYSKKKADLSSGDFNLIGGTAWLWANAEMRQAPVDVLVVDEAGQLSLADALAASSGARNMLFLGDPLQLAQVSKAEHPGRSGLSVLEHVLGEYVTVPAHRGVFLAETYRMHPDVCRFISQQIYEGRLASNSRCAQQATQFGTGLRWLATTHQRRSTQSPEEAEVVVSQIEKMVGTPWTNERGDVAPLGPEDFMVVAPYNDQVRLLREACASRPRLRGVQVGTVDKFQGREAPVVFFTMTTSSGEDMPRGPEFLFSRNRLNVAVSRARCLAYLVCTESLLNSRATDIDDMRLISTLSSFVEYAQGEVE